MALWDLLVNVGNNVKQGVGGLYDKIRPTQAVITPIQQAENGGVDLQRSLELALAQPKSLKENLLGRTVTIDSEAVNPDTNELEVSRVSKFQPGLFNDISAGAKENFATGFAAPNWEENKTADGRQKGLGYRIGEGLGTFGRFAESPLGRGLLMAGIVGASGGSGLEALAYGGGAGMLNQQNRMKDTMYRRELEKYGIDTSGIRGYIGDDTFNKYLQSKQLQDNAEYRNLMLATQQRNQELANTMAQQKFDYQQKQDARELALGYEKIKADREKRGTASFSEISSMRKEFSGIPAIKNFNEIKRQYNQVTNTYNAYKLGKLKANAADQTMVTTLNKILDPDSVVRESEFARTAAGQSLIARLEGYANKLSKGGGGLTNAEREDLYAAMQEMYKANEEEANAYIQSYTDLANRYGINPADIMPRQYYQSSQTQSTTNNDPLSIRG